jgi:hypothetical protein
MYSPLSREMAQMKIDDWHRQAANYGRGRQGLEGTEDEGLSRTQAFVYRRALALAVTVTGLVAIVVPVLG